MKLAFQHWKSKKDDARKAALLHGMGGTGSLWRPIAASIDDEFDVLAFDQRGHGGSRIQGPNASYTPIDYGRDVVETLEAEGFHPTWLVGHSMGVRTTCAVAHLRPDMVQGMILIDLGFYGPAGGGLGSTLYSFLKILPSSFESRAAAKAYMDKNCPDPSIAQYLMAVSTREADGGVTFPFEQSALLKTIEAAKDFSIREWIREAAERGIPVLALRGENSRVWTREEFDQERKRFSDLPNVEFEEFQGAGHGLPFEKRQKFAALMKDWTTRKSSRSPQ